MIVEGKGEVAPTPLTYQLSVGDVGWLRGIAAKRNAFQRYSSSSDTWRRGVISNPTMVGLCGELAFSKWLASRCGVDLLPDTENRRYGDGGNDFVVLGKSVDVKTRRSGRINRVKRYDGKRGGLCPLRCDLFVFASVDPKSWRVDLLGWITRRRLRSDARLVQSSKGPWKNWELADRRLFPMRDLENRFRFIADTEAA